MKIVIEEGGKKFGYEDEYDNHTVEDMLDIYKGLMQSMGYVFKIEEQIVITTEE